MYKLIANVAFLLVNAAIVLSCILFYRCFNIYVAIIVVIAIGMVALSFLGQTKKS